MSPETVCFQAAHSASVIGTFWPGTGVAATMAVRRKAARRAGVYMLIDEFELGRLLSLMI
jgi:hypothetical protein